MIPISFELKELHVFALSERRHNKNSLISRLLCVPLTTDRRLALIVRGDESLYRLPLLWWHTSFTHCSALQCSALFTYGLQYPGGIFLQKVVIFFLSLKAYHGQVFDPSVKIFTFLSLSWRGDPKNVRHDTHFPYGGSGALGGLEFKFLVLKEPP